MGKSMRERLAQMQPDLMADQEAIAAKHTEAIEAKVESLAAGDRSESVPPSKRSV